MTDDELERALFALPLEETPADLRARIFAATIDRPRLVFRAWEIWIVGTLLAVMVWLTVVTWAAAPDAVGTIDRSLRYAVDQLVAVATMSTAMWLVLGISSAVWISQLTLPAPRRRAAER